MTVSRFALLIALVLAASCSKKDNKQQGAKAEARSDEANDPNDTPASEPAAVQRVDPESLEQRPPGEENATANAAERESLGDTNSGAAIDPVLAEKAMVFLEEMAAVIAETGTDCDKMAAGLESLAKQHAKTLTAMQKAQSDGMTGEWVKLKMASRAEAAQKKMMPGLMKCARNAKVQAVVKSFSQKR